MYKQIGKNLCKMMVAFPIAIYWVLPHLFTEKTDTDVTGLLIGRIWGMTAGNENSNILEAVGMLSYLLMFTWNVSFMMFATCVNLLLLTTILINLGTIFCKTATAFGVCWIGIILLKLLDMVQGENRWLGLINPMSYEKMLQWPAEMVVAKIVGLFWITVLIIVLGAEMLKRYEVYEWKM